ncbi:hypothetical protein Agub_g14001, partial [Astrephomene gubernaculifera]
NMYLPVCDQDSKSYPNWCHCRCYGCTWFTPCNSTPPEQGNNVLKLYQDGYDYLMFTVDATQRMPYTEAEIFCRDLGYGWDLVPYDDASGYSALQGLCASNYYTCWFKKGADDEDLCPLIDAQGLLQKQGCEQDVRFVCRKER